MVKRIIIILCFSIVTFFGSKAVAQCPQFFDSQGALSATPQFVSCSGAAFNLSLISNLNIGNYTIDWGDASLPTVGNGWVSSTAIQHNYVIAVTSYNVTITLPDVPCVVVGTVTMEEPSNASIQIPFGGLTSVCAPGSLDFINSSTDVSSNTVFTWDFGDGSPPQVFNSTNAGQTVSHLYLQGTVNCVTQVTLSAENTCNTLQGGASVASFNPIRIWDIDDAAITASATLLCYPDTSVTLSNTTQRNCFAQGNIEQRYEYWNLGDYWGLGQDSILDWSAWPPTFPLPLNYPGIGSYTAMLVDSSFCGLDTAFITIQIVPPPTAGLSIALDTICEGENVSFNNLSGGGANSYFWNFGDGTGWNASGGGSVNHTYSFSGDFTIQIAAFIGGGTASCTDTATIPLHVLPSPVPNFNFNNNNGCDSLTVTFTDFSSADVVNWSWNFGNGNASVLEIPPAQNYNSPGNYNVTLIVSSANSCTDSLTQVINVFESPVPAFSPTSVCMNDLSLFTDLSTSSVGDPIITWAWDFGDGNASAIQNPSHTYVIAGPVDVVLVVSTAFCSTADTIPVTVETVPTASFNTNLIAGCAPLTINFTNTSSASAVIFNWDFGDGDTTTSTNPNHIFTNNFGLDTTYTVRLIAQTLFGCSDTTLQTITVYPKPTAAFTHNAILDCAPLIVGFTNNSVGGVSYSWNFGDGTPLDAAFNPVHTYNNSSLFIDKNFVSLVVTSSNGCTDTIRDSVTVYPEPIFGFSTNPDSGCSPLFVQFPSVIGAVQYQWDFGDGSTGTGPTPNHTYINSTTNNVIDTITLIATSSFGCADTSKGIVLVFPSPTAAFTSNLNSGCHPLPVNFTNNSTGATIFSWDFGDGDTSSLGVSNVLHTYNNTTGIQQTHQVVLIVETNKGCKDTLTQNIDVFPEIIASYVSDTAACSPFDVSFTNTSTGATTYSWNFGDGNTSIGLSPNHIYPNITTADLTHTVELIVTSSFGCSDTVNGSIRIYPLPVANFTSDINNGCHPLPVNFTNASTGATFYHWDMGDGITNDTLLTVFGHTYTNTTGVQQTHQVILVAETDKGCLDSVTHNIDVYPDVTAIYNADTMACSPFDVDFINASIGAVNYFWNFGDGSAINNFQNPSHQYTNNTALDLNFTAQLIIESFYGCFDTTQKTITVYTTPVASFNPSPFTQVFPNATVSLNNSSSLGVWQYDWDFGDLTGATIQSPPNHAYSTWGIFDIELIVTGLHCADTVIHSIEIIPPVPIANFQGPATGCKPLSVQFTNSSEYGTTYLWSFGDGGSSALFEPSYTYFNPGIFTVTLTVFGPGGQDIETQQLIIEVYQVPSAFFTVDPTRVFIPNEPIQLFNLSSFASSYLWTLGDGSTSTEESFSYLYTQEGVYDITLIASTPNNCMDTFMLSNAVEAILEGDIIFPNAFTPSENGGNGGVVVEGNTDNDVFHPIVNGAEEYELNIFNKWGELLFVSNDVNIGWDGYYRNELSKQDVYIYKVQVRYIDGRTESFVGDITLLR